MGLAQAMPATWEEWMGKKDPFDPEQSIIFYAKYMSWLLGQTRGDLEKATASYNAGIGRVTRLGERWRQGMPDETKTYLVRINRYYAELVG